MDEGQAGWIMRHLVTKIKKTYFEERAEYGSGGPRGPRREPDRLDHQSADCEACSLMRCPQFRLMTDSNMRKGRQRNNQNNLEYITWVLIDENDHIHNL
jgi:hypothetical protein